MGNIRDAERTKKAILEAASNEFAEKGFAGARVSSIAKRAGVNVQMLYHYFRTKENLFKEITARQMESLEGYAARSSIDPLKYLSSRFRDNLQYLDHFRMATWEAAQWEGDIPEEDARKESTGKMIAFVESMQRLGGYPSEWDPRLLFLALHALALFPIVFWPVTYMATGKKPTDPEFQRMWAEFLDDFSRRAFGGRAD